MNIEEAKKLIVNGGGQQFFIPSFNKKLLFKEYTTGMQKVLSKTIVSNDQYVSDMTRLGLFDNMLLEGTHEYKSGQLTIIDMIAFISQIKKSVIGSNNFKFDMRCGCGSDIKITIDLDKIIERCKNYEFKHLIFKCDLSEKQYEFELKDASWMDLIILRESLKKTYDKFDGSDAQFQFYFILNKICMYIKSIKINNDEVKNKNEQSFDKWTVPERIKFFDLLNPKITIDDNNNDSLLNIITKNFSDRQISEYIFNNSFINKKCDSCGENVESVFTYDNFFQL